MVELPSSVAWLTDSECCIAALEKSSGLLLPFFANRVSEACSLMDQVKEISVLEPIYHVAGPLNIADLATRGEAKPVDLSEDSEWMSGPTFLSQPRESWPVSREFRDMVPAKEMRAPVALVNAVVLGKRCPGVKSMLLKIMDDCSILDKAISVAARLLHAVFD